MTIEKDFKEFFKSGTLYRSSTTQMVKGRPVDDDAQRYTSYAVNFCIQPAVDRNMNQDKVSNKLDRDLVGDIDIYTSLALLIRNPEDTQVSGDRIIYLNRVYELVSVGFWDFFGTQVYKYTACYIPLTPSDITNNSIPSENSDPTIDISTNDCFLEALIKG
jgi:hypothetical protein